MCKLVLLRDLILVALFSRCLASVVDIFYPWQFYYFKYRSKSGFLIVAFSFQANVLGFGNL